MMFYRTTIQYIFSLARYNIYIYSDLMKAKWVFFIILFYLFWTFTRIHVLSMWHVVEWQHINHHMSVSKNHNCECIDNNCQKVCSNIEIDKKTILLWKKIFEIHAPSTVFPHLQLFENIYVIKYISLHNSVLRSSFSEELLWIEKITI